MRQLLPVLTALGVCACTAPEPRPAGVLDRLIDDDGELRAGALASPDLVVGRSRATGVPDRVRPRAGAYLAFDEPGRPAGERARDFLARYGAVLELDAATRAALPVTDERVTVDAVGQSHVRLAQTHAGLPVLGAELIVHLDERGVLGVNGTWVPDAAIDTVPALDASAAAAAATRAVAKRSGAEASTLAAATPTLAIVRTGLLAGVPGHSRLAYGVEVSGAELREQTWIDADTGAVLERYSLRHDARHRIVYTPVFEPDQPDLFKVREEGQAPTLIPMVDHLYDYSGHVYDMFQASFGRDSFDGAGAIMRTVYLVNQNCPNAYWDGATTNYCPGFDLDDVVAHEWGHAYTQHTHGLIYAYQSGALNESYSDIWGETIDLLNGVDGLGGANNAEPAPGGQRWAVGEDFGTGNGEYELLLRDMWDPDRLDDPGFVTSPNYACTSDDGGGVHTNSGVPNHAYALLVDGGTFRGVTVGGIGLVKAAHVYYQAMIAYQGPSTTFAQHADALEQACADLTGVALPGLFTLPGATITAADCAQVAAAMLAVEMRTPPPCDYQPVLDPGAPAACPGATALVREDWSDGLAGWTSSSAGVNPEWPGYAWSATSSLPGGRTGHAAFAIDSVAGSCAPGGDYSGRFAIDSATFTAPAGRLELRFDHHVETEAGYDGGNLWISRNGGAFILIPEAAFRWNPPNATLTAAAPIGNNTNPKAGEPAWSGTDEGGSTGSWGTTVVDLSQLVAAGDTYRLRFDFGIDGCNGVTGWHVGALAIDQCPELAAPALTVGSNYEAPDRDGRYTLQWSVPAGASSGGALQESTVSCAPQFADAGDSLGNWNATTAGLGALPWQSIRDKPGLTSKAMRVLGLEGPGNLTSTLTSRAAIALPGAALITLRWKDFYVNEPDDRGFVEVSSDGGATWSVVYTADRALQIGDADLAFLDEPLTARSVDLSGYAGRNVLLRFRYVLGASNYFLYKPVGWWIDDVTVESTRWSTVYSGGANHKTLAHRPTGTYCYRARSRYLIDGAYVPGSWSEVVTLGVLR